MQEDKKLKELLQRWAVENPSADFTSQVMHRVTSAYASEARTPSLFKQNLPRLVLTAFILVCIALLTLSFMVPASAFPFQLNLKLPAKYFLQSIQLIAVFWVVMLLNLAVKKYSIKVL